MKYFHSACRYLSENIKQLLCSIPYEVKCNAVEIVMKADTPLYLICKNQIIFIKKNGTYSVCETDLCYIVSADEIREIILRTCGYSLSAHQKEIEQGYISLGNGCRMAIGNKYGTNEHSVSTVCFFDSIRIRIAREIQTDTSVFLTNGKLQSVLLVGQPGSGKTTLLRNIAKNLANGTYNRYYRICVIDERNEIYPDEFEKPSCIDVISCMQKHIGINRAVRLYMPEIIICDEIGTLREAQEILQSLNSGVKFICSVHAQDMEELQNKECYRLLSAHNVFNRIIILQDAANPGRIREIKCCQEIPI